MVLKIYGFPQSACTKRVMMVCKELNLPYELVKVDPQAGDHKKPAHLEHQPFGLVPYIDDDGFFLFESRAIARYLVVKHSSPLMPLGDLKKMAIFEQASSVEQSEFDPYAAGYAKEKFIKPLMGLSTNEEAAEFLKGTLESKLKVYEKGLGLHKYLAGDEITLADLFHIPYGAMLTNELKFTGLTETPNLARWWNDITSRPSWKAVQGA
ncbi:glutathione S-transferase-like protein [Rickenella mellea]|uniref:glutathione transferase n=1 Tax=Rickenella mellea TaxID=50990 RepID=A0A4Y7Q919_9AGAM|nr:glutathione S-transferase-like protein [Rickenella mellea]